MQAAPSANTFKCFDCFFSSCVHCVFNWGKRKRKEKKEKKRKKEKKKRRRRKEKEKKKNKRTDLEKCTHQYDEQNRSREMYSPIRRKTRKQ